MMNELSLNQDHSIEDSFSHNFQGPDGASSLNSHRGFNRVMVLDRDILKGINQEMEFDQEEVEDSQVDPRIQIHDQIHMGNRDRNIKNQPAQSFTATFKEGPKQQDSEEEQSYEDEEGEEDSEE